MLSALMLERNLEPSNHCFLLWKWKYAQFFMRDLRARHLPTFSPAKSKCLSWWEGREDPSQRLRNLQSPPRHTSRLVSTHSQEGRQKSFRLAWSSLHQDSTLLSRGPMLENPHLLWKSIVIFIFQILLVWFPCGRDLQLCRQKQHQNTFPVGLWGSLPWYTPKGATAGYTGTGRGLGAQGRQRVPRVQTRAA